MIECDQLAKIQVGNTILTGTNNTLHLDGTHKRFNEYSSFQVTTGDGQGPSMAFKDMPAGSANDYDCNKGSVCRISPVNVAKEFNSY